MIQIKTKIKQMEKIEQKHWIWFQKYQREKLCKLIKERKVSMDNTEYVLDDKIVKFLKGLNNDYILKKLVIGKVSNNIVTTKESVQTSLGDLCKAPSTNLDTLVSMILKKYFDIFQPIIFKDVMTYLNKFKKDELDKIRDLKIKQHKKKEKCRLIKIKLKRYLQVQVFKYLREKDISNIEKDINNLSINSRVNGFSILCDNFKYNKDEVLKIKTCMFQIFNYEKFINDSNRVVFEKKKLSGELMNC